MTKITTRDNLAGAGYHELMSSILFSMGNVAFWWYEPQIGRMSRRLGFLVCVVTKRLVTVWPKLVFVEKRNELFGDWSVGCWRVL